MGCRQPGRLDGGDGRLRERPRQPDGPAPPWLAAPSHDPGMGLDRRIGRRHDYRPGPLGRTGEERDAARPPADAPAGLDRPEQVPGYRSRVLWGGDGHGWLFGLGKAGAGPQVSNAAIAWI